MREINKVWLKGRGFPGLFLFSCVKISVFMKCKFCDGSCRKSGRQKNGAQKLRCKACGKYQQTSYRNNACKKEVQVMIPQLVCERVSVRGIARVLKIAAKTVLNDIRRRARDTVKPLI